MDKTNTIIVSELSGFNIGISPLYLKKHIIFKKPFNHGTIDNAISFSIA
ncbi:hypothetical protein [Clostridium sp. BL8]|nr:hypothetical protein [Clostridium sp. BL8]